MPSVRAVRAVRTVRLTDEQMHRAIVDAAEGEDDSSIEAESDLAEDEASSNESDHESEEDVESDDADFDPNAEGELMVEAVAQAPAQVPVQAHSTIQNHFVGRDGTIWQTESYLKRRLTHNSLRNNMSVNKVILERGKHIDSAKDAFNTIITDKVIEIIVKYTNVEGARIDTLWREVDAIEIRAFIGLLIGAGIERSSKRNYEEFFHRLRGQPIFRATMGLKRFKAILRYIRFDDKDTRVQRRQNDKLAPIRDIFSMINANLGNSYSPGKCLGKFVAPAIDARIRSLEYHHLIGRIYFC